jgi:hypothetical protein
LFDLYTIIINIMTACKCMKFLTVANLNSRVFVWHMIYNYFFYKMNYNFLIFRSFNNQMYLYIYNCKNLILQNTFKILLTYCIINFFFFLHHIKIISSTKFKYDIILALLVNHKRWIWFIYLFTTTCCYQRDLL